MRSDAGPDWTTVPIMFVRVAQDAAPEMIRIAVRGEVDASTADELRVAITGAVRQHRPGRVVIDLAGVTFLDSTGINALLVSWTEAGQTGCRLSVVGATPAVYRVLEIVGLTETFAMTALTGAGLTPR